MAKKYKLGSKSKSKLVGLHPDLKAVVELAIKKTKKDFTVLEGMRTRERQRKLVRDGKSTTMNSRHLTGHAVDIAPWPISWEWKDFYPLEKAMKDAAKELGVPLEWGGDWKSFPDGPHFQLPWSKYPK